jgi:ABC-type transporter Mla subunit MlaD
MGEAMSQLQSAGDQLSQSEQLEQEKNQLDSSLASLQDAKNDLNSTCSQCNGTGQSKSGGT